MSFVDPPVPPLHDVELRGLVELASIRFDAHGRELFRLRSLALRVTSLVGLAGVSLAYRSMSVSRILALAELAIFALPAFLCAPGLAAGTLAAARGQPIPRGVLAGHAGRAFAFWAIELLRVAAVLTCPLSARASTRLHFQFAEFLMIDERASLRKALDVGGTLSDGTDWTSFKLSIQEWWDAIQRYDALRCDLDSRVRRAMLDVLLYDALRTPPARIVHSAPTLDESAPPALDSPPADSAAPLSPEAASAKRGPTCPRCGDTLVKYEEGELKVLRCANRHGVWANNETSLCIVRAELPTIVLTELSALDGKAEFHADPRDPIECPACRKPLVPTWVHAAQVHVDACSEHGTWFDSGELERVTRAYAQAARDRREIAALLKKPQLSPYARGLPAIRDALLASVSNLGNAALDTALEGREEDRAAMWIEVAGAAAGIITGDKSLQDLKRRSTNRRDS